MINLKNYIKEVKKFLILEEFLKNSVEEQQDLLQNLRALQDKFNAFMEKVNKIAAKNDSDPQEIFDEIVARAKEQGSQEEQPREAPQEESEPEEDGNLEEASPQEEQQN